MDGLSIDGGGGDGRVGPTGGQTEVEPWGLVVGQRPCAWCGAGIDIVRRPGRPRLYCDHACRQRAYEHRHGFVHARTVLAMPGQHRGDEPGGRRYEEGRATHPGQMHALRTSVRPEGSRRETVCGLLAKPVPGRWFEPARWGSCETCAGIVERHPLTFGISPSNELSRLRSLIVEGLEQRHRPDELLSWLADHTRLAQAA